ncbi:MAG: cation:dicarboxylase symporter family transporter [Weeksellaceae bacterium]|jgi:proton glutamate symport protein
MKKKLHVFIPLLFVTITAILVGFHFIFGNVSKDVLFGARWLTLLSMTYYCIKSRSLTTWIIFSIIVGAVLGYDFPGVAKSLHPLSQGFIKLVKTIVGPILFATLVYGIAGHSDLKQVGRMAWKSLAYFYSATTLALIIGLIAINLTQAGKGIDMSHVPNIELPDKTSAISTSDAIELEGLPDSTKWIFQTTAFFRDSFPENIMKSIHENKVLQIVVFAVLFGIGLALVEEKKRKPLVDLMESLAETMFKYTKLVMYFAPLGVGAAMAYTIGHMGLEILKNLIMLLLTLYGALIVFLLGVLLPVALYLKVPIRQFVQAIKEPVSIAFATTSSDAALPLVMQHMEKFGVPRKIVSFVVPTGYSFNLDGTTLYLSLASIFVAQAAGMDLSIGQQLLICLTLMITSKGVAAVPRASLIILIATADQFGLPLFVIAAILGIDELMDMARTSVNVIGNCLASVVIAKWEGEFDQEKALNYSDDD